MNTRARQMAALAALARTDQPEALRRKAVIDRQPRVHDIGGCCRAIRGAMRKIKQGRAEKRPVVASS